MASPSTIIRLARSTHHAYRVGGVLHVAEETIRNLKQRQWDAHYAALPPSKHPLTMLAADDDVLGIDWDRLRSRDISFVPAGKRLSFAWVMSPPGPSGGGHQNIFRFIRFLEDAGHECSVYLYSTKDPATVADVDQVLQQNYDKTAAPIKRFRGDFGNADAIFATGWETAYPIARFLKDQVGLYFVQDFEPAFYGAGSAATLAENTYRMGFHGITAGDWLSWKLSADYDMVTDSFQFGADTSHYRVLGGQTNQDRPGVFFYARPVTERRAFQLGILALSRFHLKCPDVPIHMAGWDVSDYDIPFPYENHGALPIAELPTLYNQCSAALVLSLTNLSLLPYELLSCGVTPVMNGGKNTEMVCRNEHARFVDCEPTALGDALVKAHLEFATPGRRKILADSVDGAGWAIAAEEFVTAVERACWQQRP